MTFCFSIFVATDPIALLLSYMWRTVSYINKEKSALNVNGKGKPKYFWDVWSMSFIDRKKCVSYIALFNKYGLLFIKLIDLACSN